MTPPLRRSALVAAAVGGWWQVRRHQSRAVQSWRPSTLPGRRAGPLHVRAAGSGDDTVVLLHGLVATGNIFGDHFDELASHANLVVPDLLGFGRSLDEKRTSFSPDDHLDALEAALSELGLADRPLRIGAHSMGSALAMRWIQRDTTPITSVACFGPPVYRTSDAIDRTIASSGLMARVFVTNTRSAQAACHLNCSHRWLAGIVAAAASPQLPVPIARSASLHTWPAYRDAMDQLIRRTDWTDALRRAATTDIRVCLVWGEHDRIGDRDYASTLPRVTIHTVEGAGHHLPMTDPALCLGHLEAVSES
ncbi:MAG: pimeloyl-ACP methyl ester carboxylesterase [Acidimicrobiales bacterium]|jgi:pimeloyl-ACP methyl ester carboxylesterase